MAKLVALYNSPEDPAAFDAYYVSKHVPLARKVPGVRKIEFSTGPIVTPEGAALYHRLGILTFDSMADLQSGLNSPAGQTAVADLANFAGSGVTILLFEHREA
jgi:uncharacterized protein (TIGR02118 family)